MSIRNGLFMGFLVFAGMTMACDDPVGPTQADPITELPRALTPAEKTIIARSNQFGLDLLMEVDSRRTADQPNTILSPLSASMALGMALEGADGETFLEIQEALGFEGMSREDINASYGGLLDLLLDLDPAVEVGIANSAWSREGFPFNAAYFDAITSAFGAVVREVDFSDPATVDVINKWVKDQTKGRIDSIIEEISPLDILFLINAVYFKGTWTTQFDKGDTHQAGFRLEDGSTVSVPMMVGEVEKAGFAQVEGQRAVAELPYGGQAFTMVTVLPGPDETVAGLMEALDDATWTSWMASLQRQTIFVQMPKFELDWDGLLNAALNAMGVEKAFKPFQADFSRMTPAEDAHISEVRQKTYMRVDEEGTEAAAVTSVTIGVVSAPPGITLDRPYLLAIRERLSGTIIFLGAVRDPR